MHRYFPQDDAMEKALTMLAALPQDVIRNICRLAGNYSANQIMNMAEAKNKSAGWSLPMPYKMFSDQYGTDFEAFHYRFIGVNSLLVLQMMKREFGGFDMYQEVFEVVFKAPAEIARVAAAKVETYDIIGGNSPADAAAKTSFLKDAYDNISEAIRRAVNWWPERLGIPIENDQVQKFDNDRVYEMELLGQGCESLGSRLAAIDAQALIARTLGYFSTAAGTAALTGDLSTDDDIKLNIVRLLDQASDNTDYSRYFSDNGKKHNSIRQAQRQAVRALGDKVNTGDIAFDEANEGDPITSLLLPFLLQSPGLRKLLPALKQTSEQAQGDMHDGLLETLGDLFDNQSIGDLAYGDPTGLIQEVGDMLEGDPEAESGPYGDVSDDNENEGGLFTKARTRILNKRVANKQRRATDKGRLTYAKRLAKHDYKSGAIQDAEAQAELAAQQQARMNYGPDDDGGGYNDQGDEGLMASFAL